MYSYKLPNTPNVLESENNVIVLVGANGSGKSRLGAWIEQNDAASVHRISAQRSLSILDDIPVMSFEKATENLLYGSGAGIRGKMLHRWREGGLTTSMLDDYQPVLSALIAKKNKQHDDFVNMCKERNRKKESHYDAPHTDIDKLQCIWNKVFPQRGIKFDDAKVTAILTGNNNVPSKEYKGKEMSDGERVALYLIAQCLCVPENTTLIIDEPEIHLHRSIMNKLWMNIEQERPDCLFIFITHDTQFAAAHAHATKIWVKEFDGEKWEYEFVNESELPEQCLLDILGNRKNVLFVEGEENSYDTQLYRAIYGEEYHVIPCGGCSSVIQYTKAMRANAQLHHLQAYGLVDRDYRPENEINSLKGHGVFTLGVAEVENLFCVSAVFEIINSNQGYTDSTQVEKAKNYIVTRYQTQKIDQIHNAVVSELKYILSSFPFPKGVAPENAIQNLPLAVDAVNIQKVVSAIFEDVSTRGNSDEVLRVFNEKGLATSVGPFFGQNNKEYCNLVLRLFRRGKSKELFNAIVPYLPNDIPITNQ